MCFLILKKKPMIYQENIELYELFKPIKGKKKCPGVLPRIHGCWIQGSPKPILFEPLKGFELVKLEFVTKISSSYSSSFLSACLVCVLYVFRIIGRGWYPCFLYYSNITTFVCWPPITQDLIYFNENFGGTMNQHMMHGPSTSGQEMEIRENQ